METKIAIRAEKLSKRYRLGQLERYTVLRDVLARSLRAPWMMFRRKSHESFWALKNVDLEVKQGEVLGLIGRNGAGKTTLLKILSRITRPTAGWAEIYGRVGSLLEVGTGFHPELTGRENTFLSGVILGMSKKEIDRKFDEIVAFAELEKFMDTPVKHYSSGMYVRLAFAVAAHLEPEILLVDEVLAVGDIAFQKKCIGKMGDVARGGRTILFVSHQMNQVRRLCERVLWVDAGGIHREGPAAEVVGRYEVAMTGGHVEDQARPRGSPRKVRFLSWEIVNPKGDSPHSLKQLDPVTVKFVVQVDAPIERGDHGIALYNHERQLMWVWATRGFSLGPGVHEFLHTLPILPLRPGLYSWYVSLYDDNQLVEDWNCLPEMLIATEVHQYPGDEWKSVLNLPCDFRIRSGGTS